MGRFRAASKARSPAQQEANKETIWEDKLTPRYHCFKNSFPSWSSETCSCQIQSGSGHSSQLRKWSRWRWTVNWNTGLASDRNMHCLMSNTIVFLHTSMLCSCASIPKAQIVPKVMLHCVTKARRHLLS